jgi:hypothetical protein
MSGLEGLARPSWAMVSPSRTRIEPLLLPCIVGSFQAGGYPSAFPANCLFICWIWNSLQP